MFRRGLLLFFLCSLSAFGRAQGTPDETIKIDTRLVSVPVVVSDRNGRYVPNLTRDDFTIIQDGVPQRIDFFATNEEPLTLALLIDTSQSTRPVLDDIKDSARSLVKLLRPHDRAMIVAFDYTTHVLCTLTSDTRELRKAIDQAEIPRGIVGTTLREAAFQTIENIFRPIKGRKAVIILTDGKDFGSRIAADDLLNSLEESDTLVYSVMFKTDEQNSFRRTTFPERGIYGRRFPPRNPAARRRIERMAQMNRDAEEYLRQMADLTAGRFFASADGKLKEVFESIIKELRLQYRLGFYPPDDKAQGAFHEIKVKVTRPETVVRARNGYRVEN
ncbi:MAG: VWA domain-containing protein [Pyrinomonadaceae bacterium]